MLWGWIFLLMCTSSTLNAFLHLFYFFIAPAVPLVFSDALNSSGSQVLGGNCVCGWHFSLIVAKCFYLSQPSYHPSTVLKYSLYLTMVINSSCDDLCALFFFKADALWLTYELLFNLVSSWKLVGLGGLHYQTDDLVGFLYLGQHDLGNRWQVFEAGIEKWVGRVAREGRGNLYNR